MQAILGLCEAEAVAEEAKDVAFGFLLTGGGQIWADGIELEVVGDDVLVTDMMGKR